MTEIPAAASPPGLPFPRVPEIIFVNWREALHQGRLSPGIQTVYEMAIAGYLEYCSSSRWRAPRN